MRLLLSALVATTVLSAAPALAQSAAQPAKSADWSKMTPEEMRAHCAKHMGDKAQGAAKSEHGDKMASDMKKPSDAEMKAMREKCAAMMSETKKP